ncbi:MAG: hypothetical protein WDO16_21240 [Bacteroidota bacterium]
MLSIFRIGSKLVLPAIICLLPACSDKQDSELEVFKAVNESLENSKNAINKSTENILALLQDKQTDVSTSYKAKIWYPKAMVIQQLSKDTWKYVEQLKAYLRKDAGLDVQDGTLSYNEKDKDIVKRVFITNARGTELYDKLKVYKEDILSVDPGIRMAFTNSIELAGRSFDHNAQDFSTLFFSNTSPVAALSMLNQVQNNIKIVENATIQFCNNKINTSCGFL